MGYCCRSDFIALYMNIRNASTKSVCPVLVLPALTVDAVCCLRILTVQYAITLQGLFESDFIPFRVVPVQCYEDVSRASELYVNSTPEVHREMIFRAAQLSCLIVAPSLIWPRFFR